MSIIKDTRKYFLNPAYATSTDSSFADVTFNINGLIRDDPNILYYTIGIVHAEIPYSFYVVNKSNNLLSLSTSNIIIPYGNYNANSLMKQINQLLPINMNLSFDTTNGKMTLSYNQSFSILPSTTMYKLLGLEKNKTYNSIDNVIQFPYLMNVLGTKNLYFKSNVNLSNFNSVTKDYVTISCIPVNVEPYGIILYNNYSNSSHIVRNKTLDNLIIQIYDDENNLVDFNNVDWNLTIEITSYIERNFDKTTLNSYLTNDINNINNN
jgi:hypothetical protein